MQVFHRRLLRSPYLSIRARFEFGCVHLALVMRDTRELDEGVRRCFSRSANPIQVTIMRALALFLLAIVLFWAVDEVAFDGRNGAQVYQAVHYQGQKLKAEVKSRLNSDDKA